MRQIIDRLLGGYEQGNVSRRELIAALAGLAAAGTVEVAAQSSAAPLKLKGINHVTMFVSDMNRSVAFYQKLFGMPVQSLQQGGTNLNAGAENQFLGLFQVGPTPRIDHVCLNVDDFDQERVMATLRENGVEGSRVRMRGETAEIYFTDPDGLSVQLQSEKYCGGEGLLGDKCA
jgi:catechol 2,3-dioxygenase-like lactoylglutathione lyase family enzyme